VAKRLKPEVEREIHRLFAKGHSLREVGLGLITAAIDRP